MSRVLVTGATGFIGRPAVAALAERGHEVVAVTRLEDPGPAPDRVRWERADLLTAGESARVVAEAGTTHLLHLAWVTEPGAYWTSPSNERWLDASLELLRAFADGGGRRAVVAGTCAEYDWSAPLLSEQTTPLEPATPYGRAKNRLRKAASEIARKRGLGFAWGRLFFLYGPGERPERLVPSVTRALLAGDPVETTDGAQRRDFLFAPEAADALVTLLDSGFAGSVNVGSGEATPVRTILESIGRATGAPDLIRLGARPQNPGEPPELVADVTRLRDEINWRPRVALDEGIERTVSWWRDRDRSA